MNKSMSRRTVLRNGLAAGALMGLGDLSFLGRLPVVSAAETVLPSEHVRLDPGIEPLVRLLEETPRERLLEEIGSRIRQGLSYREVLAALLLAGVKNVEPRPSVGFKFHAVLVVNSAHLASLSSPPEHRWLPIFWALDYYKSAAARDVEERGDWVMPAVRESSVPSSTKARSAFIQAMDNWDESGADAAAAGLARTAGANEIYELFFRYGARDFRSIGHKAIFVANSWRTLQCIGWRHAEPVLRSLAYALLNHEGDNPARRDADADRPFKRNIELLGTIRPDWRDGQPDAGATSALLETLRAGSPQDASDAVIKLLNQGVAPQSVWDALFVEAGEMLMQKPAIVALHAVTTTNALHFAYQTSGHDETRRLMLLQNAAFLPMFRAAMGERGKAQNLTIQDLKPQPLSSAPPKALDEIFSNLSGQPGLAAGQALAYLDQTKQAGPFIDAARVLVFLKGSDAHDYKFSSAILEDYHHISPPWRNLYLASNIFKLRGAGEKDNSLVQRTRQALQG